MIDVKQAQQRNKQALSSPFAPNPFNQDLNTTDSVEFKNVKITGSLVAPGTDNLQGIPVSYLNKAIEAGDTVSKIYFWPTIRQLFNVDDIIVLVAEDGTVYNFKVTSVDNYREQAYKYDRAYRAITEPKYGYVGADPDHKPSFAGLEQYIQTLAYDPLLEPVLPLREEYLTEQDYNLALLAYYNEFYLLDSPVADEYYVEVEPTMVNHDIPRTKEIRLYNSTFLDRIRRTDDAVNGIKSFHGRVKIFNSANGYLGRLVVDDVYVLMQNNQRIVVEDVRPSVNETRQYNFVPGAIGILLRLTDDADAFIFRLYESQGYDPAFISADPTLYLHKFDRVVPITLDVSQYEVLDGFGNDPSPHYVYTIDRNVHTNTDMFKDMSYAVLSTTDVPLIREQASEVLEFTYEEESVYTTKIGTLPFESGFGDKLLVEFDASMGPSAVSSLTKIYVHTESTVIEVPIEAGNIQGPLTQHGPNVYSFKKDGFITPIEAPAGSVVTSNRTVFRWQPYYFYYDIDNNRIEHIEESAWQAQDRFRDQSSYVLLWKLRHTRNTAGVQDPPESKFFIDFEPIVADIFEDDNRAILDEIIANFRANAIAKLGADVFGETIALETSPAMPLRVDLPMGTRLLVISGQKEYEVIVSQNTKTGADVIPVEPVYLEVASGAKILFDYAFYQAQLLVQPNNVYIYAKSVDTKADAALMLSQSNEEAIFQLESNIGEAGTSILGRVVSVENDVNSVLSEVVIKAFTGPDNVASIRLEAIDGSQTNNAIKISAENIQFSGSASFTNAINEAIVNGTVEVPSGNVVIRASSAPNLRPDGDDLVTGDIWINTTPSAGNEPYSWSGSSWVAQFTRIDAGRLTTGTIDASVINVTNINGQNIQAYSIRAEQIDIQDIFTNQITVANNISFGEFGNMTLNFDYFQPPTDSNLDISSGGGFFLGRSQALSVFDPTNMFFVLKSAPGKYFRYNSTGIRMKNVDIESNYSPGSSGWKISSNGDAELNDVTVRGTIIANNGTLQNLSITGGIDIVNNGAIKANNYSIENAQNAIGSGIFIGEDLGSYKFAMGSGDKRIWYDGVDLNVGRGRIVEAVTFVGVNGKIMTSETALMGPPDGTQGAVMSQAGFFAGLAGQTTADANVRILSSGEFRLNSDVLFASADNGLSIKISPDTNFAEPTRISFKNNVTESGTERAYIGASELANGAIRVEYSAIQHVFSNYGNFVLEPSPTNSAIIRNINIDPGRTTSNNITGGSTINWGAGSIPRMAFFGVHHGYYLSEQGNPGTTQSVTISGTTLTIQNGLITAIS